MPVTASLGHSSAEALLMVASAGGWVYQGRICSSSTAIRPTSRYSSDVSQLRKSSCLARFRGDTARAPRGRHPADFRHVYAGCSQGRPKAVNPYLNTFSIKPIRESHRSLKKTTCLSSRLTRIAKPIYRPLNRSGSRSRLPSRIDRRHTPPSGSS
jgi:hypothetical protein